MWRSLLSQCLQEDNYGIISYSFWIFTLSGQGILETDSTTEEMHWENVFVLFCFLLMEIMSTCPAISRPYSMFDNTRIDKSTNIVHNVTANCGDYNVRRKVVYQCQYDGFYPVYHTVSFGYPWSPGSSQRYARHKPHVTEKNDLLRDALDSLNHVCYTHDRSQTCLEESGIQDYCATTIVQMNLQPFSFLTLSVTISGAMRT